METNPYAPPKSSSQEGGGMLVNQAALREIVLGWEKLRLKYNVILLVPGVVIEAIWVTGQGMPMLAAVLGAIFIAIGANLAFFLGPLAELYFRGLFRNGRPIGKGRAVIFGAGLVVSAGVFGIALLASFA